MDIIQKDNPEELARILAKPESKIENSLPVIGGIIDGSFIISIVHILKSDTEEETERVEFLKTFSQKNLNTNDLKQLLEFQSVTSHCSLIAMGLIPFIKSNNANTNVDVPSNFNLISKLDTLAALQDQAQTYLDSSFESNRDASLNSGKVNMEINAVSLKDINKNKIIDVNSMMTALDDYIQKSDNVKVGVPINFYIKYVNQRTIATSWLKRNFPEMVGNNK